MMILINVNLKINNDYRSKSIFILIFINLHEVDRTPDVRNAFC